MAAYVALALVPAKIRCVRADSDFFAQELFEFLEQRAIPYAVAARLDFALKRLAAGVRDWKAVDEDCAAGEFFAQLHEWDRMRRFVVIRERVRESKAAIGRKLFDVPGGHRFCDHPRGRWAGALAGLQSAGRGGTED